MIFKAPFYELVIGGNDNRRRYISHEAGHGCNLAHINSQKNLMNKEPGNEGTDSFIPEHINALRTMPKPKTSNTK